MIESAQPRAARGDTVGPSRSWLWLLLGGVCTPFMSAQTSIAVAAWLAPIWLLRFCRTTAPSRSLPAVAAVVAIGTAIAFRSDFIPGGAVGLGTGVATASLAYALLFGVDRLLWQRFGPVTATLVFPCASTSLGYLSTLGAPGGTAGSEAYSQTGAVLMQLTSVTGIWGPVFAMAWAAAVVNAWWERGWSVRDARRPLCAFAVATAATVAYGSIRLVTADPLVGRTVRVAALAPEPDLDRASRIVGLTTSTQRAAAAVAVALLDDDLLARSRREARAGAKIIVWSEAAAKILEADESAFLARASGLARTEGVYLQVGLGTFANDHGTLAAKNRAIMFKPDGTVAWDYAKTHITAGDIGLPGPGRVPILDTPYGRLATVICQDDMFPRLTAQAGRLDADILLIPSSDWPAIATWHDRVSVFRALETGATVVRATRAGISSAVDPYGTVVARRTGSIDAGDPTLVATVPTHGAPTLYPYLTDMLAFGCLAALLALIAVGLCRGPRVRQAGSPDRPGTGAGPPQEARSPAGPSVGRSRTDTSA